MRGPLTSLGRTWGLEQKFAQTSTIAQIWAGNCLSLVKTSAARTHWVFERQAVTRERQSESKRPRSHSQQNVTFQSGRTFEKAQPFEGAWMR
jgi:hypothetical protein